jgi:hypothetical protein
MHADSSYPNMVRLSGNRNIVRPRRPHGSWTSSPVRPCPRLLPLHVPTPPALLAARWWLLWCRPHRLTAPPLIVWLPAITADGRYGDGPTATFLFRRAPNLTSLPLIRGPHRSLLIQKEFLYPNMKRNSSLGHLYECRTRI